MTAMASPGERLRRPEEFRHEFVDLREVRMHFVREGKGTPLLLVHGWPGFWWEWHKNIGPLSDSFEVICPDMRGYGDTTKPPLGDISAFHIDKSVDDLAQLLDALGVQRVNVVGHDYSSIVMYKFIRKYRDKVNKAVFFNPITPGFETRYLSVGHFPESWYSQFHQLDLAVDLVTSSRAATKRYFKHFLSHWSSNPNLWSEQELEIYADNFAKPGNVHGGFNWYRANLSITSRVWNKLDYTISDVPTYILWGMDDPVVPISCSDLVAPYYVDFRYKALPATGHFVQREAAGIVNSTLKSFFLGTPG